MAAQGCLIAICGIDGSGKTLQSELLRDRAAATGLRVEAIDFPRYDQGFFGKLIARYLRGEISQDPAAVDPYLAALPFACDRWEALPVLREWLEAGAVVISNRYVAANLAHQGSKIESPESRREFLDWVERLEYDVFGLPRPDVHVLLDVSPEVAATLIARKQERKYLKQGKDIHESNLDYLAATGQVYRDLAAAQNWLTIECAVGGKVRPPEAIAEEVWNGLCRLAPELARAASPATE